MAKREPYIIHDHLTVQEIVDLVKRAYDEGFADGKKEVETVTCPYYISQWGNITTPLKDIQITPTTPVNPAAPITTPNDWPPNVIYCGDFKGKTTFNNETL